MLLLLLQELFLPLAFLTVFVVLGEVAVLAHTFGVVELVGVLTCPRFLRLADLVLASNASLRAIGS